MTAKLAYIASASHSGSTLLTMLLNGHPRVATVGELSPGHMEDLAFYRCSCQRLIRECPFWARVGEEVRSRGIPFDLERFPTHFAMPRSRLASRLLGPLHRGAMLEAVRDAGLALLTAWPRHFREVMRANEAVVRAALDYYGADVFVDKGNKALRLKHLLRGEAFNIRVIHLVRDGRAVALTYMDPAQYADAADPASRGGGAGHDRSDERMPMAEAAYQWRRCMEEAEHALARLDRLQWIRIRYEDLCRDADGELDRIFRFLDMDSADRLKDFRSIEHHVVGNGMRLDTGSDVRLDDRWRSALTEEDIRVFDGVAGAINRRYGYS